MPRAIQPALPDPAQPADSTTGEPWYTPEEWKAMRLSSKSHWDVPVRLPDGTVLHVIGSGMWRPTEPSAPGVEASDHFPVWIDIAIKR